MFPLPANEAFPSLCCRCIVRSPKCEASCKRGRFQTHCFEGQAYLLITRAGSTKDKNIQDALCVLGRLTERCAWCPAFFLPLTLSQFTSSVTVKCSRLVGFPNWHESGCYFQQQVGGDHCSQTSCKVRTFDWLYGSKRIKQEAIWGLGVSLSGSRGIIRPHPSSVRKPSLSIWQE